MVDLDRVKRTLLKSALKERIEAVYVFGSEASQTATEKSDLDLAILFLPTGLPSFDEKMDLRLLLEHNLGKDVDLLVLNQVSPIVAMQVVTKGRLIIDRNPHFREKFEATLFSRYAELKELRAPMEKAILKRKFYG